jgi:hypothetical protein
MITEPFKIGDRVIVHERRGTLVELPSEGDVVIVRFDFDGALREADPYFMRPMSIVDSIAALDSPVSEEDELAAYWDIEVDEWHPTPEEQAKIDDEMSCDRQCNHPECEWLGGPCVEDFREANEYHLSWDEPKRDYYPSVHTPGDRVKHEWAGVVRYGTVVSVWEPGDEEVTEDDTVVRFDGDEFVVGRGLGELERVTIVEEIGLLEVA